MLCVKTKVLSSPIHGMGLFADQDISAGTVIWRFARGFDQVFDPEQLKRLPTIAQIFLARYAYMSTKTGRFILDTDNARYFNHADTPNSGTISTPGEEEDPITATKNITRGEEITIDYRNQEWDVSYKNILWAFYEQYDLVDEADPRLKMPLQEQ